MNDTQIGDGLDALEWKSELGAVRGTGFRPGTTFFPYRDELPRCLDDEPYSCPLTSACRRQSKSPRSTKASTTAPVTDDPASDGLAR